MNTSSRIQKKSYAMQRMARAIERAVHAGSGREKERAARWVGAWGMLCGIRSATVRLRQSDVAEGGDGRLRQPSSQIEIPGEVVSFSEFDSGARRSSTAQTPTRLHLCGDSGSELITAGIFDSAGPA